MSILRDLVDTHKEIQDSDFAKINHRSSVAVEANRGILQFPVLCTSSASLEEATLVNKALERQFVSFVRILTSIDTITTDRDVSSYLSRIHQNYKHGDMMSQFRESSMGSFKNTYSIPLFDEKTMKIICENDSNMSKILESDNDFDEDDMDEEEYDLLDIEDEEDIDIIDLLGESFKTKGCKVYKIKGLKGLVIQENADLYQSFALKDKTGKYFSFTTPKLPKEHSKVNIVNETMKLSALHEQLSEMYVSPFRTDKLNDKYKPNNYTVVSSDVQLSEKYNTFGKRILSEAPIIDGEGDFAMEPLADDMVSKNNLNDNDVKKSNELVPSVLQIKTHFKNDLGEIQQIEYLIGVKAMLHVIQSKSMIDNIVRGVKRGRGFFNFVKWTSGEIEFFRDFILTIDDIRDDIKGKFNDSHWWNALRRRRKYSKVLKAVNFKQQIVPNASLVISMEEVQKIKSEYSIDLMNVSTVRSLMEEYFLVAFVVIDSSIEVAYFYFDGQPDFYQHSFTSLERENSNQAKQAKEIMQILGKM